LRGKWRLLGQETLFPVVIALFLLNFRRVLLSHLYLGDSELDIESLARNGRKVVVVAEKIVAFESF